MGSQCLVASSKSLSFITSCTRVVADSSVQKDFFGLLIVQFCPRDKASTPSGLWGKYSLSAQNSFFVSAFSVA